MDQINSWAHNQIKGSDSELGMTQLLGLFWLHRHFGQTVRPCVGTRQWQPAAGRAVGGIASDQLWHAVCIWTNADMLTRWVPNSRARQSTIYCPLSAGELDGGGTDLLFLLLFFFLIRVAILLSWCTCNLCVWWVSCALWYLCLVHLFVRTQMNHTLWVYVHAYLWIWILHGCSYMLCCMLTCLCTVCKS